MQQASSSRLPWLVVVSLLLLSWLSLVAPGNAKMQESKHYNNNIRKTKEDFLVHGLGKIEPAFDEFDGDMYAGLMPTTTTGSIGNDGGRDKDDDDDDEPRLFFWLFAPPSTNPASNTSLTVWLNGGPGCSSLVGALFENGPITTPHYPAGFPKTTEHEPLESNKAWSWTKATNMLFLEMPAGTGFSLGPLPKSEDDIAKIFHGFLSNFYDIFPDMLQKDLYIFGESYAGMYVPSVAHKIHQENQKQKQQNSKHNTETPTLSIPLKGIGLGNAWMDAKVQGPMVVDYAWWHGLIDSTTRDILHEAAQDCVSGNKHMKEPFHDFTTPDECSVMGAALKAAGAGIFPDDSYQSPNPYDVTTFDLYPVLFNPDATYYHFFNHPDVKDALHAPVDVVWEACIPGAGRRRRNRRLEEEEDLPGKTLLAHDMPESVVPYVAELLDDAGIRVLVYNGDRDLSTCAQGSETLLDRMEWSGSHNWKTAPRGLWMVDDKVAGYAKSMQGLDFVVVYNSGHLVPNNVPGPALDLITRFVNDQRYIDKELPSVALPGEKAHKQIKKKIELQQQVGRHPFWAQAVYVFVAGIFCFGCGILVGRGGRKRQDYTRILELNA